MLNNYLCNQAHNNLFLIKYKLAYSKSYADRIYRKYWVAQTMSMIEYFFVFHECVNSIFNLQIVKHITVIQFGLQFEIEISPFQLYHTNFIFREICLPRKHPVLETHDA